MKYLAFVFIYLNILFYTGKCQIFAQQKQIEDCNYILELANKNALTLSVGDECCGYNTGRIKCKVFNGRITELYIEYLSEVPTGLNKLTQLELFIASGEFDGKFKNYLYEIYEITNLKKFGPLANQRLKNLVNLEELILDRVACTNMEATFLLENDIYYLKNLKTLVSIDYLPAGISNLTNLEDLYVIYY
ncbi:hypothetical protein H8356DRAFT_1364619 [Neocallimastix lanati (nom. inval.)]|nr:hypothetical protein H8356DRAFT_1364619 [Neocallimastix sp. JGI-2020a]